MKKNVFLGLLLILTVFSFFSCGGDDEPEIYTVTIGTLTNANGSTITANPTSGVEGTEITLTVYEDNTYRLKYGTLKNGETAINETTLKFNLPAENVIITAEFQSLLIGSWQNDEYPEIITFYENGIYSESLNTGGYFAKGTWTPQNGDTVNINRTHFAPLVHVAEIDDFNETHNTSFNNICVVLSNNKIKIIFEGNYEETFKFIN